MRLFTSRTIRYCLIQPRRSIAVSHVTLRCTAAFQLAPHRLRSIQNHANFALKCWKFLLKKKVLYKCICSLSKDVKKRACISHCSGVEPRNYGKLCIVLYRIVLYCIVLETKTIFMLYLFNQMILPFHFSSTMSVQNSFKCSITAITLSYDIAVLFKINSILPLWVTFYTLI